MSTAPESSTNDELAQELQRLLEADLEQRGLANHCTVEVGNFADLNLDVHITLKDAEWDYDFKYIGIGYLRKRVLSEMSLQQYASRYVSGWLEDKRRQYQRELEDSHNMINRRDLFESSRNDYRQKYKQAQQILKILSPNSG